MDTMNKKTIYIIYLIVLSTGCSHSQESREYEDFLATNIRSDGSKEFYYTVTMPEAERSQRGGNRKNVSGGVGVKGGSASRTAAAGGISYGGSKGGHKGRQPDRRPESLLTERLEKKLLASGYCRDGWMETDRQFQTPNASIRGECDEAATERDHREFPNTEDA